MPCPPDCPGDPTGGLHQGDYTPSLQDLQRLARELAQTKIDILNLRAKLHEIDLLQQDSGATVTVGANAVTLPAGGLSGGSTPYLGNQPGSGNPATDQYYWQEQDAEWRESRGDDNPALPLAPIDPRFNQYIDFPNWDLTLIGGSKGELKNTGQDPCNGSSAFIQKNSYVSKQTGNPGDDSVPSYSIPESSTAQNLAHGLAIERVLADAFTDPVDSSDAGSLPGLVNEIQSIVAGLHLPNSNLSQEQIAEDIVAGLVGLNQGIDPSQIGNLPPGLVQVLNEIANAIAQDPTGAPNFDWNAFADYLNAQADADQYALQISNLGGGSIPCGDIQDAVNKAKNNQRNKQRAANNALKKFDKNIKPPPMPPGGTTGGNNKAPAKFTNFTGVRTSTSNTALSPLGHHTGGLLPSGPEILVKGPAVADATRNRRPAFQPARQFGRPIGPQVQEQAQIGQEDLSHDAEVTLTGEVNKTIGQYYDILKLINLEDAGDPQKWAEDYSGLCDATLQELVPLYHHLEDILNHSRDYSARAAAQRELASLIQWLNRLSFDYTKYDSLHRKSKWWP